MVFPITEKDMENHNRSRKYYVLLYSVPIYGAVFSWCKYTYRFFYVAGVGDFKPRGKSSARFI